VPAVLLEMGFITTRTTSTCSATRLIGAKVMDAVGDAIDAYFVEETHYALK